MTKIAAVATIDGLKYNEEQLRAIEDESLTYEQYQTVRANTPGFRILLSKLTNGALQRVVEKTYLPHASYQKDGASYNDAIIGHIVPELLKRLPQEV